MPFSSGSEPRSLPGSPGWGTWIGVGAALAIITAFHYLTSPAAVGSHNIYRRLYYLPIVWAAFAGGWRGGLGAAAVAAVAYLPHAFFLHHQLDPAPALDKALEIILYFGVGGLAGLLVDRERKARRRQALTTRAQLEAEARAERLAGLVRLSSGLAHEIRNPLGGIQGALEILGEAVEPGDRRREMLGVGLRECGRLSRVLDDFLAFARPRSPQPQTFDAADCLAHVAGVMGGEAAGRRIELAVEAREGLAVWADREQITQVLVNLAKNALQAVAGGGRVILGAEPGRGPDPSRVVFFVTDDGAGVPAGLGDTIYDPYVTGREGGSGLGLAISAHLVRQNRGEITHEKNDAGGATFRFALPVPDRRIASREDS